VGLGILPMLCHKFNGPFITPASPSQPPPLPFIDSIRAIMLPFDVLELLKGNSVRIVFDNAKSHGSRIKGIEKPKINRRMSEPFASYSDTTPTPATASSSRWDSAPSPSLSLPKKPRGNIRDHAPQLKFSPASPSQTTCACKSLSNVSKPVRRISGTEKTILSISLSFNEIKSTNKGLTTSELISKALGEVHLFDDDDDDDVDDDDDDDDVATVRSAPARLVTVLTSA
jgi:hypothetical protein